MACGGVRRKPSATHVPQTMIEAKYRIDIIESEKGWGKRVDESLYFDSKEEAELYRVKFNAQNTGSKTPDWYQYAAEPVLVDMKHERR